MFKLGARARTAGRAYAHRRATTMIREMNLKKKVWRSIAAVRTRSPTRARAITRSRTCARAHTPEVIHYCGSYGNAVKSRYMPFSSPPPTPTQTRTRSRRRAACFKASVVSRNMTFKHYSACIMRLEKAEKCSLTSLKTQHQTQEQQPLHGSADQ